MSIERQLPINYVAKDGLNLVDLRIPSSKAEYSRIEALLDEFIDEVRFDEEHPLAVIMQILGENLETFDDNHHQPWV